MNQAIFPYFNGRKELLFTLAVCAISLGCDNRTYSFEDYPEGIAGGAETDFKIWRGVVSVLSEDISFSTATFIHPDVVLTSGHSVKQDFGTKHFDFTDQPESVEILAGDDIFNGGEIFLSKAQTIVAHPSWKGKFTKGEIDLALIRLEGKSIDTGYYCIAERDELKTLDIGDEGIIVGYGLVDDSSDFTAGVHRMGNTTITDLNDDYIEIGGPTSVCPGDSGGPLFIETEENIWKLAGVTSRYSGQCSNDGHGFEVGVLQHLDWIERTLSEMTGDTLGMCSNCGQIGFDCPETMGNSGVDSAYQNDEADCDCGMVFGKPMTLCSLFFDSF